MRAQDMTFGDWYRTVIAVDHAGTVEPASGLPAEPSGSDVLPEQRARTVLRVAEPVVHHLENRDARVEADEVRERERTHRVVHAELHHLIDRLGRADAFHQRRSTPR